MIVYHKVERCQNGAWEQSRTKSTPTRVAKPILGVCMGLKGLLHQASMQYSRLGGHDLPSLLEKTWLEPSPNAAKGGHHFSCFAGAFY